MRRSARRGLALTFLVGLGEASCSGNQATATRDATVDQRSVLDGPSRDLSGLHDTDGRTSDLRTTQQDSSLLPLPASCGGTVQATGTTPSGSFSGHYIFIGFSTCGSNLTVSISQTDSYDTGELWLHPTLNPQTNSFLRTSSANADYLAPGSIGPAETVLAEVTLTSFPPTTNLTQDGGLDPITGSFSIDSDGFSITGGFSSSLCWSDCLVI